MFFAAIERWSPNYAVSPEHEQLGVCFHHSVSDFDATIELMLRPESQVSYHCLIAPDGTRCTLVRDEHIAWHAGASTFHGRSRCNDFLLGVAFAGDTTVAPLTHPQVASAIEWLEPRWHARGWTLADITDHRHISPGRKADLDPAAWAFLMASLGSHFAPKHAR